MKTKGDSSNLRRDYEDLVRVLGDSAKFLERLKIDPGILESFRHLLRFLRSRPEEAIAEIIQGSTRRSKNATSAIESDLSEDEIQAMSTKRILELAANEETTRRNLERIASVRFGVTKGALSALRNRQALVEKLCTLVRNEDAHGSITRIARQSEAD
jgi:hypothetical protein